MSAALEFEEVFTMRKFALLAIVLFGAGRARADLSFQYSTLDVPGASTTIAWGINDQGQIVGWDLGGSGRNQGFLRNAAGDYAQITPPGSLTTYTYGINSQGQIVGEYQGNGGVYGFIDINANYTTISEASPYHWTVLTGINDQGDTVGYYAANSGSAQGFLLSSSGNLTLMQGAGAGAVPTGINNAGQIVGYYTEYINNRFIYHDFLLNPNGTLLTIDEPNAAGYTSTPAINNKGQIVGLYADQNDRDLGFLRNTDGSFTTINIPGSIFTEPTGINDQGEIVGYYGDSSGNVHGFIATPTPEPSTFGLALLSSMVGIYCGWRTRRRGAFAEAASTINVMPAMVASGSVGHASKIRARSGLD